VDAVLAKDPSKTNLNCPQNPVVVDDKKLCLIDRLKKFTGIQGGDKAEVESPSVVADEPKLTLSNPTSKEVPDASKGGFFDNFKKFITPSEKSKEIPLESLEPTNLEQSPVPAVNSVDNTDNQSSPSLFDSFKQLFDKKGSQ
jgi:hypothetical protein